MAKILKCPRCQEKIDVTDLSGGSTVRCEACGTMVRISGGTQPIPKAAVAAPAPAAAAGGRERGGTKVRKPGDKHSTKVRTSPGAGRQTELFRKMNSARSPGEGGRPRGGGGKEVSGGMSTGMIVGIAAGVIIIIAVAAFALMGKKDGGGHSKSSGSSEKEAAAPVKKKKKDDPKPASVSRPEPPTDSGTFKPGARTAAGVGKDVPDMKCNPDARQTYEAMVTGGRISEIVNEDYKWITYVFDGLLSDNEAVVKNTCDALHQIIVKRKLDASQSDLGKQSTMNGMNMPEIRGGEYTYWAQWWLMLPNRNAIADWATSAGADPSSTKPTGGGVSGNAATEDWPRTLGACRSGGFMNSNNEEYYHFQRVKSMGKSAYPKLVEFIDNEDSTIGTAAVLMLKELTGRSDSPSRVNDGNKAQVKADWNEYIKKN
ncbi:MAG TPA: hypothetical protein VE981_24415 [Planctomycetota bacterium]|nr:hypothetical protein [Planctomycetota bacterium]